MLGLEDYGSSGDEEPKRAEVKENARQLKTFHTPAKPGQSPYGADRAQPTPASESGREASNSPTTNPLPPVPVTGPVQGPSSAPSASDAVTVDNHQNLIRPNSQPTYEDAIHSMTLPPVPKVAIPLSPPGSPLPSTPAKVSKFLELKNQGVHFNTKLESSIALRNPNYWSSLMDFAGIDKELGQYGNTLPEEVAFMPRDGFPKEAYVDELAKAQQEALKKREEERKRSGRTEFAPAVQPSSRQLD